jgi:hypothetical protein
MAVENAETERVQCGANVRAMNECVHPAWQIMNTCETCRYWSCMAQFRSDCFRDIGTCTNICLDILPLENAMLRPSKNWGCVQHEPKENEKNPNE